MSSMSVMSSVLLLEAIIDWHLQQSLGLHRKWPEWWAGSGGKYAQ